MPEPDRDAGAAAVAAGRRPRELACTARSPRVGADMDLVGLEVGAVLPGPVGEKADHGKASWNAGDAL